MFMAKLCVKMTNTNVLAVKELVVAIVGLVLDW